MKAEESLYSFRFVFFWNEYPWAASVFSRHNGTCALLLLPLPEFLTCPFFLRFLRVNLRFWGTNLRNSGETIAGLFLVQIAVELMKAILSVWMDYPNKIKRASQAERLTGSCQKIQSFPVSQSYNSQAVRAARYL
jgi:hypothetical protein